ncbi:hypothetical protein [Nesterenkonia pannonica]|uniref:hypothetical protein n=1 Tax=Nesterenkonia pannonica TaxID=1548602 RepID=UPI00216411A9|nr:hypothetical protein [Nesterenkonia pannonica]
MKNAHPLIAGVAALALTLTACGGGDTDAAEETGDEGAGTGTATAEHMYGTTEVELPEDGELRVVALGWSDAEVALALAWSPSLCTTGSASARRPTAWGPGPLTSSKVIRR